MNSFYPIWWDTPITLYNQYKDPETDEITWFGHNLSDCFWKYVGDSISPGFAQEEKYDTVCRIPENELYLPNHEWRRLSDIDKAEKFTLSLEDIIIKGNVDDVIDEYTQGQRSTDLLAKYKGMQGCITVKEFAIDVGPGRVCPHYRIYGI